MPSLRLEMHQDLFDVVCQVLKSSQPGDLGSSFFKFGTKLKFIPSTLKALKLGEGKSQRGEKDKGLKFSKPSYFSSLIPPKHTKQIVCMPSSSSTFHVSSESERFLRGLVLC